MWSQFTNVTDRRTDRRTDRQTTCDGNTALCTKVHRAVKTEVMNLWQFKNSLNFPRRRQWFFFDFSNKSGKIVNLSFVTPKRHILNGKNGKWLPILYSAGKRQHSVSFVYRSHHLPMPDPSLSTLTSKLQNSYSSEEGVAAGHSGQFVPCGYLSTLWYTLHCVSKNAPTLKRYS